MNEQAQLYFEQSFLKDVESVGKDVLDRYSPLIRQYNNIVIPFQKKRLRENQSLIFQNSTLERDKIELLQKIQQLKAQNQRFQYTLEKQLQKINQLERKQEQIQRLNLDNLSLIQSLRLSNHDYEQALQKRDLDIQQVEKDKSAVLQKYQMKNGDYNILLANYMKDKNMLAQKLNQMNELQQSLHQKQKQIQSQKFYLKKQWEQFDQKTKKPEPVKKQSRIFGSKLFPNKTIEQQPVIEKQKNPNSQILRLPLKKIVKHHQSEIYDLSFNYNGNLLASCGGDRMIKVFDVANLRAAATINSNSAENIFISNALNYTGDRILAGSTDKTVSIFSTETGKQLHSFPGHGDKVNSVAWSSSKEKCISGSEDKQMKVWDIEKASNILSVSCGKGVKVVKSNSVEPVVYTGHSDGSVRVYSITQGNNAVSQVKGVLDYPISSLTLLSNRHHVVVTSLQGSSVHILDLKMNKSIAKFQYKDFYNSATHAAVSPSESLILAGNCDGSIYYWNRFKGDFVKKVSGHDGAVTALNYTFMNSMLASADKQGSLILWQ